uniref:Exoribonuclease phosphorolytic domain-containing protein n=1 Tax=Panagrolaimus sp. JU765 TaxID=591449 RepID=A0AC34QE94_9BILA
MGLRNFIEHSLPQFARENPQTVVYVVPIRNATPTLRAEYSNGRQVHINAKGFTHEQAGKEINMLRTRSGEPIVKFESAQTAHCRSVQGEWSTLTWLDPKQNSVDLPNKEFSVFKTADVSATEYLLNLVQKPEVETLDEPKAASAV